MAAIRGHNDRVNAVAVGALPDGPPGDRLRRHRWAAVSGTAATG